MLIPTRKSELANSLHKPIRTCAACRKKATKSQLLRIAKKDNLTLEIDIKQIKPGRGAYLCFDEKCFRLAVKRSLFARMLKQSKPNLNLDDLLKILDART